ncbi:MAG TPA: hypothetical protein VNP04_22695 [Alphaproteobacteria bacterium]|nr:hypothetical protein [Alphaproteobacteria bacterium]
MRIDRRSVVDVEVRGARRENIEGTWRLTAPHRIHDDDGVKSFQELQHAVYAADADVQKMHMRLEVGRWLAPDDFDAGAVIAQQHIAEADDKVLSRDHLASDSSGRTPSSRGEKAQGTLRLMGLADARSRVAAVVSGG